MVTCHTSWLAEVDWVAGSVPTVQMYPLRLEVKRQNECQRVGTECILEYSGVCDEPRRERLERNWVSASVENQRPGIKPYSGQCQVVCGHPGKALGTKCQGVSEIIWGRYKVPCVQLGRAGV